MLRKLIKYEWKSTYKLCGALIIFMAVMTLLGCVSFYTPMWTKAFSDAEVDRITAIDIAGILGLLFYIISLVGVLYGTFIFLGIHFFKGMYSEEGYLTHTLPVTPHQLMFSKILVSGIWYLVVEILMVLSMCLLVYALLNNAYVSMGEGTSLWAGIMENREAVLKELQVIFGENINVFSVVYFIMLLITPFTSMIILFGAITLGQLSSKHKVMMSIVSYFAITVGSEIISSIIIMPISFAQAYNGEEVSSTPIYLITLCLNLILAAVLYFISHHIMTKKLNLE